MRPHFLAARAYQRTTYLPGEIRPARLVAAAAQAAVGLAHKRQVHGARGHASPLGRPCLRLHLRKDPGRSLAGLPRLSYAPGRGPSGRRADNDTSLLALRLRPSRPAPRRSSPPSSVTCACKAIVLGPAGPSRRARWSARTATWRAPSCPCAPSGPRRPAGPEDTWTREVAFRRHHRRVGAVVGDAWRVEQGYLAPLPDPAPDTDRHTGDPGDQGRLRARRRRRLLGAARASSAGGCRSGSRPLRSRSSSRAARSARHLAATCPPTSSSTPSMLGRSSPPGRPSDRLAAVTSPSSPRSCPLRRSPGGGAVSRPASEVAYLSRALKGPAHPRDGRASGRTGPGGGLGL